MVKLDSTSHTHVKDSLPCVLFLITQTGNSANGGLRSISEVMKRLSLIRPHVVTNLESPLTGEWRDAGIDVTIVRNGAQSGLRKNPFGYIRTYLRHYFALQKLATRTGARVIHANDPLAFQLALPTAKTMDIKLVLNLRDTLDPDRTPPRTRYRRMFAAAARKLYLSHDMAQRWLEVASNAVEDSDVTYSIIDASRFHLERRTQKSGHGRVLVSGVFRPKKGQLDYIEHVGPKLAAHNIQTVFAGDFKPDRDDYSAECYRRSRQLGDAVRFVGYAEAIEDHIAAVDVIAVPSRHEGLMRTMIEGMAMGCPVVSFDVASAREMLERDGQQAGIVVPLGDYDALADAIVRIIDNPAIAERMGRNGAEIACQLFNPAAVTCRHEQVYVQLSQT